MKSNVACTLRLEEELYARVKEVARTRHLSFTAFVQGVLAEALKREEQKALYDAFTLAGEDGEGADVDFALSAQREVVERHE